MLGARAGSGFTLVNAPMVCHPLHTRAGAGAGCSTQGRTRQKTGQRMDKNRGQPFDCYTISTLLFSSPPCHPAFKPQAANRCQHAQYHTWCARLLCQRCQSLHIWSRPGGGTSSGNQCLSSMTAEAWAPPERLWLAGAARRRHCQCLFKDNCGGEDGEGQADAWREGVRTDWLPGCDSGSGTCCLDR